MELDVSNTDIKEDKKTTTLRNDMICNVCKRHFERKSAYASHIKFCGKKRVRKFCSTCKESFDNKTAFHRHIRKKHKTRIDTNIYGFSKKSEEPEYECKTCDRKYRHKDHFVNHQNRCNGLSSEKFCKICNIRYSNDNNLWRHMSRKHQNRSTKLKISKYSHKKYESKADISKQLDTSINKTLQHKEETDMPNCNIENQQLDRQCEPTDNSDRIRSLRCVDCNLEFSHNLHFEKHMEKQHKDTSKQSDKVSELKCSVCSVKFSHSYSLKRHMKRQHDESSKDSPEQSDKEAKFECSVCSVKFSHKSSFTRHMQKQHKETSTESGNDTSEPRDKEAALTCSVCLKICVTKSGLKLHEKVCSTMPERQYCKECKVQFASRNYFQKHIKRYHKNDNDLKTEKIVQKGDEVTALNHTSNVSEHNKKLDGQTAKGLTDVRNVKDNKDDDSASEGGSSKSSTDQSNDGQNNGHANHVSLDSKVINCSSCSLDETRSEEETVSDGFTCEICQKKLKTFSALCSHKKIHNVKRKCVICEELFEAGQEWKKHLKVHKNAEKKYCYICGKSYESSSGLNKHMQMHKGRVYPCEICNKQFSASHTLKNHMMAHKGEKPYICEVCGAQFGQRSHLLRHNTIHTGERKYVCETCNKTFSDSSGLRLHERIHTGSKPYECFLCNKKFAQMAALKAHKSTHFMKRKFQCDICDRTFTQKHSLLRHNMMHQQSSGIKPGYITKPTLFCNKCPKGFTTRRGLVRHMQKHTKGILPVLLKDDIAIKSDDKTEVVTALISSVHGHYQSAGEIPVDDDNSGIDRNKECNQQFATQNSTNGENVAVEKHEASVASIGTQGFDGQTVDETQSLISQNRINSSHSSYFTQSSFTDFSDVKHLSEIEESRKSHNSSELPVTQNVAATTFAEESQIIDGNLSLTAEKSMTLPRIKISKEVTENKYSIPPTVATCSEILSVPEGIKAVQQRILELDLSEGEKVIIEIKTVPNTTENEAQHFQDGLSTMADPAYGLNTLSNVVCNLEDNTNQGWESFRFSQPQGTKANSRVVQLAIKGDKKDVLISDIKEEEQKEDGHTSNKAETPSCFVPCISDDETIIGEYDISGRSEVINCGADKVLIHNNENSRDLTNTKSKPLSPSQENNYEYILSESGHSTVCKSEQTGKILDGSTGLNVIKVASKQSMAVCNVCSVSFHSQSSLKDHKRRAHNQDLVENISEMQFQAKGEYSNSRFRCIRCGENFKSSFQFKKHIKRKCNLESCSKQVIEREKNVESEHQAVIKEEIKAECDKNGSSEDTSRRECTFCGKRFMFFNSLKFHERRHRDPAPFICEVCGKGFYKQSHLKRHVGQHENKKEQQCFCDKCGKIFQSESQLMTHVRVHMGLDPYPCTLCTKSFRHSSNLKRHMRNHVDGSSDIAIVHSYFCHVCGKGFTAMTSLQVHLYIHKGIRPYKCELCSTSFFQKSHLDRHMKSHNGIRTVKCDQCDKMFYDLSSLKVHMRSHTGDRPYKCLQCGKGFTQVQNLRTHERKHEGIKSFKCTTCEQSFTTKMSLLRHEKRHTREESLDSESKKRRYMTVTKMKEKIIPCPDCLKLFTTRKAMLAHGRQSCTHIPEPGLDAAKVLDQHVATSNRGHDTVNITGEQIVNDDNKRKVIKKIGSTRRKPQTASDVTKSALSIEEDCDKKAYIAITEQSREKLHLTLPDERNSCNTVQQREGHSELNIVHVVEEVPYTEIVTREDMCQNHFEPATEVNQHYHESVRLANLPSIVSHPSDTESIFVTSSSVSHSVNSLTMAPITSSSVITPIFSPGVLSFPLNLVTLGPVSALQMEQIPQDQYFHQEPQWRMPCP